MMSQSFLAHSLRLFLATTFFLTTSCGNNFSPSSGDTPSLNSNENEMALPPTEAPTDDPVREPLAFAKYFRMMIHGDGATTATIGFAAQNTKLNDHRFYIDTIDHGRNIQAYRQSLNPQSIHHYLEMNNAFVRLNNLRPNTAYYFVIQDPTGISNRYWFKTAPNDPGTRLSVIAGGDSRNNRTPRKAANLLVSKLRPHVVMFGGDMTGGGSAREWKEWFEDWQLTISSDGRIYPVLAARGNHESSNEMISKLFDTPTGVYFASSFGRDLLRIYTLNTEASIAGDQTSWLQNDLMQSQSTQWKFAQYHKPIRPHTSGKSEGSNQYRYWAPLFYQHKVQLVSEADAHTVKTTWPVRPATGQGSAEGFIRDDVDGTIYIGEGCWGAPLRDNNDKKIWTRDSGKFNSFNWIFVDQEKIEIRTIRVDNAKNVGSVTDLTLFTPPSNLDIWSPSQGPVIAKKYSSSSTTVAQESEIR